jgi:hypothetical protein
MMKSLGMVLIGAAAIAFLVPRLHVTLPEGVQSTFEGRRFRLEPARRRRICESAWRLTPRSASNSDLGAWLLRQSAETMIGQGYSPACVSSAP